MRGFQRPRARSRAAPRGLLPRALVVLTLIAFTLQSFATQTHIHIQPAGAPVAVDVFDGVPAKGKVPAKNDEANCPLCQAFASAGHFVTPAVAATLLPTFSISIIALVFRASHLAPAVSHNWHGRAPPLG